MNTDIASSVLANTLANIREQSYRQKTMLRHIENIYIDILATINTIIDDLVKNTAKARQIAEGMENLTWYDAKSEDDLMQMNEIILLSRDACANGMRYASKLSSILAKRNIAVQEIRDFKIAIADIKELAEDLEVRFFTFPNDPDFVSITQQLALI